MSNSLIKSEARLYALREVGETVEGLITAAERDAGIAEGTKRGLVTVSRRISEYQGKGIDDEIREGRIDLPMAEVIRRHLGRAIGIADNLAVSAEVEVHVARGRLAALAAVHDRVKGAHERTASQLEAIAALASKPAEPVVTPSVPDNVVSMERRPAPPLGAIRKAEEAAAAIRDRAAAAGTVAPSPETPEHVLPPADASAPPLPPVPAPEPAVAPSPDPRPLPRRGRRGTREG